MPETPEASLLNEPQRRHVGIALGQVQRFLHEISIDDLGDALANHMRGYGEPHPDLSSALDPGIKALQANLRALQRLLEAAPERAS